MSRGPGVLQRRVLETLSDHKRSNANPTWLKLRWAWRDRLGSFATDADIKRYKAGGVVPVRLLVESLGCTRPDLSRALKKLEAQELVLRSDGSLQRLEPTLCHTCKFAEITAKGEAWLSANSEGSRIVGVYQHMPAERPT
jgi:DNA-binding MarR family transcriptional regulator